MEFAYARVSTKDQKTDRQVNKFIKLGLSEKNIYIDKLSGKNFDRPKYQDMKAKLREGDTIYIDSLDRLGRNYQQIINEWKEITREINADIVVLDNEKFFNSKKFKTMGDIGKVMEDQFLSLLSYVAEQERKKNKTRQREGIDEALKSGVKFGRPAINYSTLSNEQKKIMKEYYPLWKKKEITAVYFFNLLGLKKATFYKVIKQYETFLAEKDKEREVS